MEQKRTIWIVLAAGIFLTVVLGAAVILYASETKKNTSALYQRSSGSVWMAPETAEQKQNEMFGIDYFATEPDALENEKAASEAAGDSLNLNSEIPSEEKSPLDAKNADVLISTENTTVYNIPDSSSTTIDLNSLRKTEPESGNVRAQNKAAETAIRETNAVHRNVEKNTIAPEPSSRKPAASEKTAKASGASSAPAKKAAPSSAAKKSSDKFWVQAGSYTTTKNADEARAILESNKIPCEVFTFTDAKGVLHYRVRVGPYTTKTEAEYWKQRISTIPLFANNGIFVTNSTAAK
ncbi:SPOR domain-containing protein [Treponema sp.]|uniref:SPOR domain-containing protein n=1 Tax=Treponema sp. TaxID=166 RepID=UPI003F09FCCA